MTTLGNPALEGKNRIANRPPASAPIAPGGPSWSDAVADLRDRVREADRDGRSTLGSAKRAVASQRRLFDVDVEAREWAETTVLLTPTASTRLPGADGYLPPVSHLQAILDTRSARSSALSRALSDVRWRAVRVLGSTQSGYVIPHTGVYVGADVERDRFEGWRSAHIENCPLDTDGGMADPGWASVEPEPAVSEETGLVAYLMCNVPGLDTRGERSHGLAGKPEHRWRSAAVSDVADVQPISVGSTSTS